MALPDFLIIGAMKGGTSTVNVQLSRQDGIFVALPDEEVNFFSDDKVYARGLGWYETLFANAPSGTLKGEGSTHYTKLPDRPQTVERLQAALPHVRLIYIIRNPIARAVSHFIHEWTEGVLSNDIEAAFRDHSPLIDYSRYAMQLEPYLAAFGPDRVHVASLEHLNQDPQAELERIAAFLGHQSPVAWQEEQAQMNVSAERVRNFPLKGLLVDNPAAAFLRRTLVPQGLRDAVKARLQMKKRPELSPGTRAHLEGVFAEDYARLCEMLPGRDHLAASYPFLAP